MPCTLSARIRVIRAIRAIRTIRVIRVIRAIRAIRTIRAIRVIRTIRGYKFVVTNPPATPILVGREDQWRSFGLMVNS